MASTADDRTWYIIPCPSNVTLTKVDKERGTHGSIYVLWDIDEKSPVWVGQSIPALVRSVNEKAVINKEKRLHASSLYRCLRGEARKQHHKSWKVDKYNRDALEDMNRFLAEFPSVVYVSKSPELWRCNQASDTPEASSSSNPVDVPPTSTENPQGIEARDVQEQVGVIVEMRQEAGGSVPMANTPPMPILSVGLMDESVILRSNSEFITIIEE